MAQLSWLERLYWKYLSKPVSQRALFLHVLDNPLTSILEIGMGSGQRIAQLLAINAKGFGAQAHSIHCHRSVRIEPPIGQRRPAIAEPQSRSPYSLRTRGQSPLDPR